MSGRERGMYREGSVGGGILKEKGFEMRREREEEKEEKKCGDIGERGKEYTGKKEKVKGKESV